MTFALRTIDRSKLYTSIVDQLVDGIRSGAYPPGSALPAERVLAVRLGVSRSSVREAIRILEYAGVLDVRTGSGTFVGEAGLSGAARLRAHAVLLGDQSPLDVIVARRALEPVCAELAASNRHERDLKEMRQTVREQARLLRQGQDPVDVDLAFHLAIATASHNLVLLLLVERLVDIMRQEAWRELKHRSNDRRGTFGLFLEQHQSVLDAVERGDPQAAQARMSEHLSAIEVGLLGEISDDSEVSTADRDGTQPL
ncbi:MAG: FadR/GntR family transcriptional regulator [Thermoleophilia bacterium]